MRRRASRGGFRSRSLRPGRGAHAEAGSARFDGKELLGRRDYEIVRAGVGRTFQTPTVFEQLTVLENVDLAASFRLPLRRLVRRRAGLSARVDIDLGSGS